jgi:hypothetical protein
VSEALNLEGLVQGFEGQGYSPLERIILSHDGTVQALLSIIWQRPVQVRVLDQLDQGESLERLVDLEAGDLVVARARSIIPLAKNSLEVVDRIRSKALGLGQIAAALGQNPQRVVLGHWADGDTFWRLYRMEGAELYWEIREYFPRPLYQGLVEAWRWPRSEVAL